MESFRRSAFAPLAIAEVPLGVFAGIALGAYAGPAGAIAGAVIGGLVGMVLAFGHNRQMHTDAVEEERVDRELGIIDGDIGAPNLLHPPPSIGGLYHPGSLGIGATSLETNVAEGPLNPLT